jgi:hypothetical protein
MAQVPSNLIPLRVTQLPTAPVASEDSLMMIVYQGNNYQIRVGDLLSVAGVPTTRQVIAGTGMSGGGQLASNVTLSIASKGVNGSLLSDTGVTAGVYGTATSVPVLTVDSTGRVTAATSIPVEVSGYVPETRQVIAGAGLTGGGTLNANVTLAVDLADTTPEAGFQSGSAGTSEAVSRADHKHPAVDLSSDDEVDNILGLSNGGTARSLVPDAGAIIWCGADGLYVGPVGEDGQVLISNGTGEYTWGSALVVTPQAANTFFAGPTSGGNADPLFRAMVNADLPDTAAVAGTYGSLTAIPIITVNGKGVITSITSTSFTGGLEYKGNWNASTNNPTLTSSVGTNGNYYTVSVAGTTNLNGITDWQVGDWAIFNGAEWQKIDQSNSVVSVNGEVGAVVLDYADVGAPSATGTGASGTWAIDISGNAATATSATSATTAGKVANALTIGSGLSGTSFDGSASVTITNTAPDQVVTLTQGGTTTITGTYPNFTISSSDAYSGTVTSVATGTGLTGGPITSSGTISIANTAVTAASYGAASKTLTATVNAQGQLTAMAETDIAIANTQVSGLGTMSTQNANAVAITGGSATGLTAVGTDYVQLNTAATTTPTVGRFQWDTTNGGPQVGMAGGNVNLQVGQETVIYVYNNTGSTLTDGQVVYCSGSQGQRLTVALAQADSDADSAAIIGVVTESIANNSSGFVTTQGTVNGLNTNGFTDGQIIYLSPTTPGAWTATKPVAPQHLVMVGYVVKGGSGGAGSIYVHTQNGYEISELHDVYINSGTLANGNLLQYNSSGPYWTNAAPSTVTTGTATNLAGGIASQIPYQTGAGATSFIANGTAGQVLTSAGTSAPAWGGINGGTF